MTKITKRIERRAYVCVRAACSGSMRPVAVELDVTPECDPVVRVAFCCSKCGRAAEVDLADVKGDKIHYVDIDEAYDRA